MCQTEATGYPQDEKNKNKITVVTLKLAFN